jgi:hypothetical protein
MTTTFREFVDKKTRDSKKQLNTLYRVIEEEGMSVTSHLKEDDPYIYVLSSGPKLSFDGVRIYKIGNDIAFRIQKESETHPYGKAYSLDVEGMYDDYISDKIGEAKAGKKVMDNIVEELKNFFDKSAEAEKDLRSQDMDTNGDPLGKMVLRSTGTDYSSRVTNSNPSRNY